MDYDSYQKMYGGGTLATQFTLQDMERDQAKQRAALEAQQASTQATNLSNMFAQQMNPLKIQQQQQEIDFTNQTQPDKIKDEIAKHAKSASDSELAQMYAEAQKMMYKGIQTGNKQMYDMGEKLFMTHKDFMKIRETGEVKNTLAEDKLRRDKELAGFKQSIKPVKASGGGSGTPKPESMDKLHARYTKEFLEANARGDTEAAQQALTNANAVAEQYGYRRPDTTAGKPMLSPQGTIATTPPRQAPQLPSVPKPPQAQHTLAQVMAMYPGKSAEEIKAAYKRKTGVDLK